MAATLVRAPSALLSVTPPPLDCHPVPGHRVWLRVLPQLLHMGRAFFGSGKYCTGCYVYWLLGAIHHHAGTAVFMVWDLVSSRIGRFLFWLSQETLWAPCTHQPDTQTDTRTAVVLEPVPGIRHCWNPSFWCHICWTILYFNSELHDMLHVYVVPVILLLLGHMGEPVLLSVWFPVSCLCYIGHSLCRGFHSNDILPAVCWSKYI